MKFIIGNLKMHLLSPAERDRYFTTFKKEIVGKKLRNDLIVLCPPSVHLESFVKNLKSKRIKIGAQNVFWEEKGPYTGEISSLMAKNIGAEYVIVGHSERRRYFGETSLSANQKIKSSLRAGLYPIYCVGETKSERATGNIKQVITRQIQEGLADISAPKLEKIIFAYEPVWAVGTDVIPTGNEIMEAKILIKKIIAEKYNAKAAEKIIILYGGSVNGSCASHVCHLPGMSGVLVGRESLAPHEFIKIAETINDPDCADKRCESR
jgi:triosephosphate isomerase